MRLQTLYLINIQIDKKDRIKEPSKLMPFSWDKENIKAIEVEVPTTKEWSELDEKLSKLKRVKTLRK